MRCAVQSCRNDNGNKASDCSFFSFPSNEDLAQKWKQFCQRTRDFNIRTSYICMYHFIRDDFENHLKYEMGFSKKLYLKRNVVPTIYGRNLNIPKRCRQREQQANTYSVKQEELLQEQDKLSITAQDAIPFEDGSSLECAEMFEYKTVFKRPPRCRQREQRANTHLVKQEELLQEQDELSITSQDNTPFEDGSSLECTEIFECKTNFKGSPVIEIKDPFEEVMIKEEPINCLKTELETLRRANLKISEENRTYRRLFTALERDYKKQLAEYSAHLKVLEDRALAAENECRNMANKLKISFEKDRLPT